MFTPQELERFANTMRLLEERAAVHEQRAAERAQDELGAKRP
jgi:predicted DNA-binding transcriptional regulator YafY